MVTSWVTYIIVMRFMDIITARKRSLRRLCFYTCLSFCPQEGGCLVPWGGVWSWGVWRPPGMAAAAGGTHPTGMYYCLTYFYFSIHTNNLVSRVACTNLLYFNCKKVILQPISQCELLNSITELKLRKEE